MGEHTYPNDRKGLYDYFVSAIAHANTHKVRLMIDPDAILNVTTDLPSIPRQIKNPNAITPVARIITICLDSNQLF